MPLDIKRIRQQFPILYSKVSGFPLRYLDNAATTQKPEAVIAAMDAYLRESNANVHRGMHELAERATIAYEEARACVQHFLNAYHPAEIIFTKNCTEALNLVARSWGEANLRKGDVVVLSILEHHSNVVPWLQLKEHIGIDVEWMDIDDAGNVQLEDLDTLLKRGNVKLVSITGQSNVLGIRPPLETVIAKSHAAGALVCVDAGQLVGHAPIDVQKLDCDFLAFSGHKLYGPTGIGVLFGKREHLESMPPFLGGGMMIRSVSRDGFTPGEIPQKFEAGTPPITEAIGLKAAIEWLRKCSWEDIEAHETGLLKIAEETFAEVDGLRVLGKQEAPRHGCLSFTLAGIHPHDLTEILGRRGMCLRAGHHCTQPLHERLGINASVRLSVGIYNTIAEVAAVAPEMREAREVLFPALSPRS